MYKFFIVVLLSIYTVFAQPTYKILSNNLLNYPGSTASIRNPYFTTVISNTNPDILVMQEITSQIGVNVYLINVLTPINPNYTAGTFLDGPDTDNAIFFKRSIHFTSKQVQALQTNSNVLKKLHCFATNLN